MCIIHILEDEIPINVLNPWKHVDHLNILFNFLIQLMYLNYKYLEEGIPIIAFNKMKVCAYLSR